MNAIIATIRERAEKRAAYIRTVRELRAMPLDVALDLDIYQPEAHRIAERAVYGRDA